MKTAFRETFARDLKKIKDRALLKRVGQTISKVEQADKLQEIAGLKAITGPGPFFRLRIGDYRIGIVVEADEVEFVRILHRKEIYRRFP